MGTADRIRFEYDNIGNVHWAHFPGSIFSLARFQSGTVFLVANAFEPGATFVPTENLSGRFITITNPEFDHAETSADFETLANRYQSETTT